MTILEKTVVWTLVYLAIVCLFVDIVTTIQKHRIEMKVQKGFLKMQQDAEVLMTKKPDPFEATGFSVVRMKDDRIMVSFSRPHPEITDRLLTVDVILSPENFDYVSSFLRLKADRQEDKEQMIEAVPEYELSSWNRWPEVTPPQEIPMRVEVRGSRCGFKAQFIDGQWWDMRGDAIFDGPEGSGIEGPVVRYRPWEDEA